MLISNWMLYFTHPAIPAFIIVEPLLRPCIAYLTGWVDSRVGILLVRQDAKPKENNTRDSNVVPHRSTNRARTCLTSQSRRDVVLSCWYGRSHEEVMYYDIYIVVFMCTKVSITHHYR